MQELEPNEQRAKQAIILIWIVLALEIISLASGYSQYRLLLDVANGIEVSEETLESNDLRESTIAIFYLIAFAVSVVTFLRWFKRAYANLHKKTTGLLYTPGWAVGGWFVPILSFYRPYKIMNELYCETKKLVNDPSLSTRFVSSWWTLWILSGIIGKMILRAPKTETLEQLITATYNGMIANTAGILLALITVKVIQDYSKAESLLPKIF